MSTAPVNNSGFVMNENDPRLNSFLELVYIRYGNEMITQQLSQLYAVLGSTDSALNTLKDIMAMRDYVVQKNPNIVSFDDFARDYNPNTGQYEKGYGKGFTYDKEYGSIAEYQKAFNDANKAYDAYLKDNPPYVFGYNGVAWKDANDPEYQSWAKSMMIYRDNLQTVVNQLGSQLTEDQKNDPNGLYSKLNAVLQSMPTSADDFKGWQAWCLDGYGGNGVTGTGGGKIQQLLDSALTAAQSFLTTTTENLQRFLNIMEQYYKSANEILKTTTENMKTMARGIAGR